MGRLAMAFVWLGLADIRNILGTGRQCIRVFPSRSTFGAHLNCSSSAIRHLGRVERSWLVSLADMVRENAIFTRVGDKATNARDGTTSNITQIRQVSV